MNIRIQEMKINDKPRLQKFHTHVARLLALCHIVILVICFIDVSLLSLFHF